MKAKKTLRDFLGERCDVPEICRMDFNYYIRGYVFNDEVGYMKPNGIVIVDGELYEVVKMGSLGDKLKWGEYGEKLECFGYEKVPEEALDKYVGI